MLSFQPTTANGVRWQDLQKVKSWCLVMMMMCHVDESILGAEPGGNYNQDLFANAWQLVLKNIDAVGRKRQHSERLLFCFLR